MDNNNSANNDGSNTSVPLSSVESIQNKNYTEEESVRSNIAKKQVRDSHGRFVDKDGSAKLPPIQFTTNKDQRVNTTNPPDLLNFKITNPLVYIKYWWKRIMANEGVEMKLKAKPVTVFGVALIAFSLAFGLGGVVFPFAFPWIKVKGDVVQQTPIPASEWRETALTGTLKVTPNTNKYFLVTSSTEAVTLQFNQNVNLNQYLGRRILASGSYNSKTHILIISDILDLEVLPQKPQTVATIPPTPTAIPATPTASPVPTNTPTIEPTQAPTVIPEATP